MLKKVGVIGGEEVAQKMDENEGKPSDGCYRGGGGTTVHVLIPRNCI